MVPIVADSEDTASRESRSDREGVSWKHKTDINVSRVLKTWTAKWSCLECDPSPVAWVQVGVNVSANRWYLRIILTTSTFLQNVSRHAHITCLRLRAVVVFSSASQWHLYSTFTSLKPLGSQIISDHVCDAKARSFPDPNQVSSVPKEVENSRERKKDYWVSFHRWPTQSLSIQQPENESQ